MDFSTIVSDINSNTDINIDDGYIYNPYNGLDTDGNYYDGALPVQFLNNNFGSFDTATKMKNNTDDGKFKKFFDYLVDEGKLQQ